MYVQNWTPIGSVLISVLQIPKLDDGSVGSPLGRLIEAAAVLFPVVVYMWQPSVDQDSGDFGVRVSFPLTTVARNHGTPRKLHRMDERLMSFAAGVEHVTGCQVDVLIINND